MARLNIEDSLFKDSRYQDLMIKLGSRIAALGTVVDAFILAQRFWLSHQEVPSAHWPENLEPLVEVGLAERTATGVYVRGSEGQFAWLNQRSKAGKAKTDKKAESQRKRRAKEKGVKSNTKQKTSTDINGDKPPTLSLTPSPTLSSSSNSALWNSYREAFFERYKVEPTRNAKVNGQISQLASRLGQEAIEVVKFYLKHNDALYLKAQHTVGPLLRDCESLRTQMLRGRPVTSRDVRSFEKTAGHVELMEDLKKGGF